MSQNITRHVKDMVDDANASIETLSFEDVYGLLDDSGHVIVDIRDVRELRREGKIPGAFHAPRGMLEFWVDPDSPYHKKFFAQDKKYIFYCGGAWRSALAAHTLQTMGLSPVCHLEGGFSHWKKSGGPIEKI